MDVIRVSERASGRQASVTRVPVGVIRAVSSLIRPVHPGISQVLQAAVLAETADQTFDARPLQARFGLELTRLEDWVARRIAAAV
jgi:hypothetical protein